jgi:CRP-like cAMP-binding protein
MFQEGPGQPPHLLARLGAGECFGEMALVNDKPRMATARSVKRTNLLSVDRHAFSELFAYHPPLRRMFQALIDDRQHAGARAESEGQPDLTIVTRQQAKL